MKTSKYEQIPFGSLQGAIDYAELQDHFISSLFKRKTRIELSKVINYCFDIELGDCEIYYRVIDLCPSNQSEESGDNYTIEGVKCNGKTISITGRQEQLILDHLNLLNPEGVKFQTRA